MSDDSRCIGRTVGLYGDQALTVSTGWEEQGGEPWSGEDV